MQQHAYGYRINRCYHGKTCLQSGLAQRDLSSLTRDRTHVPYIARWILFLSLEGGFLTTGPPGKFPPPLTVITTEESIGNWGRESQRIKQGWVYESAIIIWEFKLSQGQRGSPGAFNQSMTSLGLHFGKIYLASF